eukprot:2167332-Pyramimonas_sp.AAC.1
MRFQKAWGGGGAPQASPIARHSGIVSHCLLPCPGPFPVPHQWGKHMMEAVWNGSSDGPRTRVAF